MVNVIEPPLAHPIAPHTSHQWHTLAAALEQSIATLKEGVPDPLWWGSARAAYDAQVEDIITELQQARWAILTATDDGP